MDAAYEVVALYDLNTEAAGAAQAQYGGDVCDTSDQLVNHPNVEAFIISLNPFAHPPVFFETLKADKPIFIEKPIALDAATAQEMADAADRRGVPVHVGFVRRYLPRHVAAMKFIRENDPGEILSITCRSFHAGETELINCLNNCPDNFRLQVSQIPFHRCHSLDVMLQYGGPLKSVSAVGRKVLNPEYPSPDEVIANLEFANGAVGQFHYSSVAYRGELSYQLHAENYSLAFEPNGDLVISRRPPLRSLREDGSTDCRRWYHRNTTAEHRQYNASVRQIDPIIMLDFLEGVRTGRPMSCPIRDGLAVAEFAEAIETSWQTQRTITFPLTGEETHATAST